jgi:ribosomal protein S12 methylthiotransferase accessory factor
MFLNYAQPIQWCPDYYTTTIENTFILISEVNQYALPLSKIEKIQQCILSKIAVEQALRTASQAEIIATYQFLDNLYAKGLIQNACQSNWLKVDTLEPAKVYTHKTQLIYDFCELKCNVYLDYLKYLTEKFSINVIFINDYLDPRLSKLSCPEGISLIVKLTNRNHFIGPLLSSENTSVEAMQYAIARNQPLRVWLENKQKKSVVIPHYLNELDQDLKTRVEDSLTTILKTHITNKIVELKTSKSNLSHYFPETFSHLQNLHAYGEFENKVTLSSCEKYSQQGGYRHIPPQKTLSNCAHLISSFSGVISSISEVKCQEDMPYITYKTSFFRNIPHFSNPLTYTSELTSLGKGITADQSKVSAICESLERYAAHYQKNDYIKIASYSSIKKDAIDPEILIGFSATQKQNYEKVDYPAKRASHGAEVFDSERELSWYPSWSLTENKTLFLPLSYSLASSVEDIKYCAWNSNGCAAGNTLEEAILQGFLEVVERDAIAMWWYNKVQRPSVSLDLLPLQQKNAIDLTLGKEWDYWVIDTSNDFVIPVFVAIAKNKASGTIMFGFGCHLTPEIAIERAVTELTQLISIKDQHSAPFQFDEIIDEAYLYPNEHAEVKTKKDYPYVEYKDLCDDIKYCVDKAKSINLETLVIPYHRPELPVSVVKVVIPKTLHIWPQLGNKRLYDTPVKLGWLDEPLNEQTINQQGLYI